MGITGKMMPVAPMGALPRYLCMILSIIIFYQIASADGSPAIWAALAILVLSAAAKFTMSFGFRVMDKDPGDAGKAQLNVKEYEGLFMALFLFWSITPADGIYGTLVTIVCYVVPTAQAVYFWGRCITGNMMPWAPMGALPRYLCMILSSAALYSIVSTQEGTTGWAALAILVLSLAAKMTRSFGFRAANKDPGDTGKAQLNVAEYEDVFLAILLFLNLKKADGLLVTIVSYVFPIAQAIYFWGRCITGKAMPWSPMGALPRYISMGISVYILFNIVTD